MIDSQFIRIGTDKGGVIEITLKDNEKRIKMIAATGPVFEYDHPKDVSEFLKMPLAQAIAVCDRLVDEGRDEKREKTRKARKGNPRMLEIY
jgi:hypothetical protein